MTIAPPPHDSSEPPDPNDAIDLTAEIPSDRGVVEATSLEVRVSDVEIAFRAEGRRAWSTGLSVAVLLVAATVGIAASLLFVPETTYPWLRLTVFAIAAGSVFLAGGSLVYLHTRSDPGHGPKEVQ